MHSESQDRTPGMTGRYRDSWPAARTWCGFRLRKVGSRRNAWLVNAALPCFSSAAQHSGAWAWRPCTPTPTRPEAGGGGRRRGGGPPAAGGAAACAPHLQVTAVRGNRRQASAWRPALNHLAPAAPESPPAHLAPPQSGCAPLPPQTPQRAPAARRPAHNPPPTACSGRGRGCGKRGEAEGGCVGGAEQGSAAPLYRQDARSLQTEPILHLQCLTIRSKRCPHLDTSALCACSRPPATQRVLQGGWGRRNSIMHVHGPGISHGRARAAVAPRLGLREAARQGMLGGRGDDAKPHLTASGASKLEMSVDLPAPWSPTCIRGIHCHQAGAS